MGKNRFLLTVAILIALFSLIPAAKSGAQPDYIRLHIIANSDSDADQALKLCVRDEIRALAGEILADCRSADEAYQLLHASSEALREAAEARARKEGFEGAVQIELGTFEFPDRIYGDELVPAGQYRAVRILLGEAVGRNWWCVVYPTMCLPEEAAPGEEITFYSSIGRWLHALFTSTEGGITP